MSSIVDYLILPVNITECEERYGVDEVERLLDSCHVLMNYAWTGTNARKKSRCKKRKPGRKVAKSMTSQVNMLWRTLPKREEEKTVAEACRGFVRTTRKPADPMEKNAPLLESWQREIRELRCK
ncbi:SpoVR family protein [Shigella flexneri]